MYKINIEIKCIFAIQIQWFLRDYGRIMNLQE